MKLIFNVTMKTTSDQGTHQIYGDVIALDMPYNRIHVISPLEAYHLINPINNYRPIKNAAECLNCSQILVSRELHDTRRCKCGKLQITGGLESPYYVSDDAYVIQSVYSNE
jgi:hypothetical protein